MQFLRLAHATPIPLCGSTAPSLDILLFTINLILPTQRMVLLHKVYGNSELQCVILCLFYGQAEGAFKLGRYHDIIEYRDTNLETISISDRFCINRNIGKSRYRLSIAMYFLAETSCDNKSHSGDNLTSSLKSCESPAVCDSHRRNRKIPLQIGPTGFLREKTQSKRRLGGLTQTTENYIQYHYCITLHSL